MGKKTSSVVEVILFSFLRGATASQNPVANYGWIKRGQEHTVKTNTGHRRLNINGAMDISTLEPVIRYDDTINANSTITLLKILQEKSAVWDLLRDL